ncbi:MAG: hypothetical protein J6386_23385 [Candidatus Synoicihabitans palmerolidicus]|nr:hypothetical protein [Candidatus Synoicihabitans palmerolidicus]
MLALTAVSADAAAKGPLLLDATLVGDAIIAVGERGLIPKSTDSGAT